MVCDVVCCGVDSQAEGADFFGATYYKLLVGGSTPSLSLYAACDERSSSSATEMVTKLASAALDLAKSFLWSRGAGTQASAADKEEKESPKIEAPKIADAVEALDDPQREIRTLSLDSSGRVCAASDRLGRVLLLDVEDMTVLRLFKGYRESEVAWVDVECRGSGDAQGGRAAKVTGDSDEAAGERRAEGGAREDEGEEDWGGHSGESCGQCLLIYAPRRKILEAWRRLPFVRVGAARMKVCLCARDCGVVCLVRAREYVGFYAREWEGGRACACLAECLSVSAYVFL